MSVCLQYVFNSGGGEAVRAEHAHPVRGLWKPQRLQVGLRHGTYSRWLFRTRVASKKEHWSILKENKIRFVTALDLIKCIKHIK